MPLVSVIIPVYNAEKYIAKCLDSLIGQSLKDFEIICVDDGSKDSSLSILQEYAQKNDRIRVVSQPNSGAGPARNRGMDLAGGKYLSILDADDFFDRDMLEHAVREAEAKELEITIYDVWDYDDMTGEVTPNYGALVKGDYENVIEEAGVLSIENFSEHIFNFTWGCAWNKLFLRQFVVKNHLRFQAVRLADDIYFTLLALVKAKRIGVLNERLVYYRINNPMSQQGQTDKTPMEFFEAYHALQQTLIAENLYDRVKTSFLNRALGNCVHRLDMLFSYEPYECLYTRLKEEFFDVFGFEKEDETIYTSRKIYECYQKIKNCQIDEYLFMQGQRLKKFMQREWHIYYQFPFERIKSCKRIVLYGAGEVGKSYYYQIYGSSISIALWVDKNWKVCGEPVEAPERIANVKYDCIIIANAEREIAGEIKDYLLDMGVDSKKIVWFDPVYLEMK